MGALSFSRPGFWTISSGKFFSRTTSGSESFVVAAGGKKTPIEMFHSVVLWLHTSVPLRFLLLEITQGETHRLLLAIAGAMVHRAGRLLPAGPDSLALWAPPAQTLGSAKGKGIARPVARPWGAETSPSSAPAGSPEDCLFSSALTLPRSSAKPCFWRRIVSSCLRPRHFAPTLAKSSAGSWKKQRSRVSSRLHLAQHSLSLNPA